jgi:hypothetical protein
LTEATVLRHYERADEPLRQIGRLWYPQAQTTCRSIGMDIVPVETVARVMAILSPRCFWSTCVDWTRQIVGAALSGQPMPAVSTKANRAKAWAELHGERSVSGPKTTAFAEAILGNESAVVIDAWTLRSVGLSPTAKVTPHRLRWITAAYAEAAAIVNETPRDLQAIVWCAVRGSAA